jgi:hypothetical protein
MNEAVEPLVRMKLKKMRTNVVIILMNLIREHTYASLLGINIEADTRPDGPNVGNC